MLPDARSRYANTWGSISVPQAGHRNVSGRLTRDTIHRDPADRTDRHRYQSQGDILTGRCGGSVPAGTIGRRDHPGTSDQSGREAPSRLRARPGTRNRTGVRSRLATAAVPVPPAAAGRVPGPVPVLREPGRGRLRRDLSAHPAGRGGGWRHRHRGRRCCCATCAGAPSSRPRWSSSGSPIGHVLELVVPDGHHAVTSSSACRWHRHRRGRHLAAIVLKSIGHRAADHRQSTWSASCSWR